MKKYQEGIKNYGKEFLKEWIILWEKEGDKLSSISNILSILRWKNYCNENKVKKNPICKNNSLI
jgi:hypothetical protein